MSSDKSLLFLQYCISHLLFSLLHFVPTPNATALFGDQMQWSVSYIYLALPLSSSQFSVAFDTASLPDPSHPKPLLDGRITLKQLSGICLLILVPELLLLYLSFGHWKVEPSYFDTLCVCACAHVYTLLSSKA